MLYPDPPAREYCSDLELREIDGYTAIARIFSQNRASTKKTLAHAISLTGGCGEMAFCYQRMPLMDW